MSSFLRTSTLKRFFPALLVAGGFLILWLGVLGDLTASVDAALSIPTYLQPRAVCEVGVSSQPATTYGTIQEAVDAAQAGDVVLVTGICMGTGITTQAVALITKSLTLRGEGEARLSGEDERRLLEITGDIDVTVENLELRGGNAIGNGHDGYGGGLYVTTGTVTLNNTTVQNNRATSGGGVYLHNSTALFKGGSNLVQNEAISGSGGGIFSHHSIITVTNSRIMTNTAQQNGGALYAESDNTITLMGGSEVMANEATLGTGGAIHANQGTTGTISITVDTIMVANHVITDHGAALYLDVTSATLKDNVFIENISREGSGAALYLKAAKAEFSGNLINNNQAQGDGGGFWLEVGEITVDNNTFLANKSLEGRGGALHLEVTSSVEANMSGNIINNNEAKSDGGGFSLRNINSLLLSNNEFNSNKTLTGNGGALYLYNSHATLNNNKLADNEAENHGGGLYAHSNSDVTLENDNELLNNSAVSGSGGALYLNSGNATINDSRISGNKAHIHGGAYYANNDHNTLNGNSFSDNQAETGHGGGLYINGNAATLTKNRIEQNSSPAGRGGGMYIVEVDATISDSHVIGNQAVFGGGLFLNSDSSVVSNNIITDNISSHGGGFFLSNSSAELIKNEIMTNTASDGGGIFLSESDEVEIRENVIAHNVGNSAGGGLYLELSNANIYHNQITSNTAIIGQAQGIAPTGRGQAQGIAPTGRGQARGIAPTAQGIAPTGQARGIAPTAQGIAPTASQEGGTGGALFLTESDATLERNTIRANRADNGGALYLDQSSPTAINNLIAENQAQTTASALYNMTSSPIFLHNTIANNNGGDGRALFITHDTSPTCTLRMNNTIFFSHSVALYVEAGDSAILNGTLWYGNQTNWAGAGSINRMLDIFGSPHFTTTQAGNYRLAANSAAIDVGVNAGINSDIDLDPRPTYPDNYDIGADEYYTTGISLDYQATPNPVMAGEELTYTIEVRNTGNVLLSANITITLPDDNNVEPNGDKVYPTQIITPNTSWSQSIPVTVKGNPRTLKSIAKVSTDEGVSANKTVTSQVIAPGAALAASFEAITDTILAGEVLTYNISVTNTGHVPLEPTITAILPGEVSTDSQPFTWTIMLKEQANKDSVWSQQIPITFYSAYSSGSLTSTLKVTAEELDPKIITETVTVEARKPALALDVSTNVPSHLTQETHQILYQFWLTNTGNTILDTPTVTITTMPAGAVSTETLIISNSNPLQPLSSWNGSKTVTVMTETYQILSFGAIASAQDPLSISSVITASKESHDKIEANVIEVSQSVTPPEPIPGESITYTIYVTNRSHLLALTATVEDILPALVTDESQNLWGNVIMPTQSISRTVTGKLTSGCLSEALTNTVKVTTEQDVDYKHILSVSVLAESPTITATESGKWNEATTWQDLTTQRRVPSRDDRVYIPEKMTVTIPESYSETIVVESLDNEGTLQSVGGRVLEIHTESFLCNDGQIVAQDLMSSSIQSSDIELHAPTLENRGMITAGAGIYGSNVGGSLILSGTRIVNSGTLRGGDGGTNAKELGGVGGSITMMSRNGSIHTSEESRILSGNGGGGEAGGGDGGIISLLAQTMNVDGEIQSGKGGNILVLPLYRFYARGGNGGTIKLFAHAQKSGSKASEKSDENECPQSILSATMTSGNGGDAVFSSPPQTGGDSGAIYLMAAPTLALQEDSKITAGQGGKSSLHRAPGNRAPIIISSADKSCPSVTLANSATQIYGEDITLFGSHKLDLSNTSEFVISATGKVNLATGANKEIDLRGNRQIIKSDMQTTLAVTESKLLLPTGLELSDVAGNNARLVEPELLSGVSLVAPEALRGKATVSMTIPFALVNRGAQTDTFKLSAESAGLSEIKISDTVTVLGGEIKEMSAIITPSFDFLDELYMTATLQDEEPQTATLKLRLIVDQTGVSRIYLPLIKKPAYIYR